MEKLSTRSIDLTGQQFGKWKVLRYAGSKKCTVYFVCECACGTVKDVKGASLRTGLSKSCGCLRVSFAKRQFTKHGYTKNKVSKTYNAWSHARQRCLNPQDKGWKFYGGRGIRFDQRWADSFEAFLADLGPCPPGYSLERKDVNGDYSPENCVWLPLFKQAQNRRTSVRIEYQEQTYCLTELTRVLELDYARFYYCFRVKGMPLEEAIALAQPSAKGIVEVG